MKLMTGREYLSKIRRKASASPWHTRVTRSAELFIRVPANALIASLGRLVVRQDEKFQENCPQTTQKICVICEICRSFRRLRRRQRRTVRRGRACRGRCGRESFDSGH